jgi:hypothetical protein
MAALGLALAIALAVVVGGVQYWRKRQVREALYAALTPIQITNCTLARYGNANDGGYLMCANLMAAAESGYSYGINGEDAWGCDVTAQTRIAIHQYDCFNTTVPACPGDHPTTPSPRRGGPGDHPPTPRPRRGGPGAATMFHAECVGPQRTTIDSRPFDTIAAHVQANGDVGKRLIMKMDVEGSEWRSLAAAPDHLLEAIDQLAVEFHRVDEPHFVDTAARLNQFFYVAHVHQNNYECRPGHDPFPGPVFEVLFVNKRIAVANPWVIARGASPLDAPNAPALPDCQEPPNASELRRVARWIQRYAHAALNRLR